MLRCIKKLSLFKLVVLGLLLSLSISCTRKSSSTNVTIDLPSAGSFSQSPGAAVAGDLVHVVINAHIPGKPTILWKWDQTRPPAPPLPIPTQAVLQLDKSPGVIIQALMIYADSSTGVLAFKYGDTVSDLTADSVTVAIQLDTVGGANPKEYTLAGRFINGVHGDGLCSNPDSGYCGPTGTLRVQFQPLNKPKLLIKRTTMLNGWFSVFGIDGGDALFTYTLEETGQDLLRDIKAFGTISASIAPAQHRVIIDTPAHYESDGNPAPYKAVAERRLIYGFFTNSPNIETLFTTNNHKVCYDNSTSLAISNLYTTAAGPSPIIYNHSSGSTAEIRVAAGGVLNIASCTDAQELKNQLQVIAPRFSSGVEEGSFSFESIFKKQFDVSSQSSNKVTAQYFKDNKNLLLKWDNIPGINQGPTGIDGMDIFMNKNPALDDYYDYSCAQLPSAGFSIVGSTLLTNTALGIPGIEPKDVHFGNTIGCPYKNTALGKVYFGVGDSLFYSLGVEQQGYLEIQRVAAGTPTNAFKVGVCEPFQVVFKDWDGSLKQAPSPSGVNISTVNTTFGKVYSDACTTPIGGLIIPANQSTAQFWVRSYVPGLMTLIVGENSGSYDLRPFKAGVTSAGPTVIGTLELGSSATSMNGVFDQCLPLDVTLRDSYNFLTYFAGDMQLSYTTSAGGSLYSDSSCKMAIPKTTASTPLLYGYNSTAVHGDALKQLFYRGVSSDINATDTVSVKYIGGATPVVNTTVNIKDNVFAKFKIRTGTGSTLESGCRQAFLEAVNADGLPVRMAQTVLVNLAEITPLNVLAASTDSTCTTPAATLTNITVPRGSSTSEIFYISSSPTSVFNFTAVIPPDGTNYLATYGAISARPDAIDIVDNTNTIVPTITASGCYPIKVKTKLSGSPLVVKDEYEVFFNYLGDNPLVQFYSEASCNEISEKNSVFVPRGAIESGLIYMKVDPTNASTVSVQLKVKGDPLAAAANTITISVP